MFAKMKDRSKRATKKTCCALETFVNESIVKIKSLPNVHFLSITKNSRTKLCISPLPANTKPNTKSYQLAAKTYTGLPVTSQKVFVEHREKIVCG